ncbi:MAG TPA: nucleotidyl transferase AbiEii/AbiGii toxin family protein [Pirellulaceae bacterium]|nr:nucleotidyl transferase AbiEii/AbiGii toxin family protein [Pirellulaceae bacterium]HMO90995.1 nucleotidyl transferase AbiEii/AbiGii toxin family protein [Pirellulaceae bacterium]HMP68110.1 nucleotidyl transferase AbiEii/AbiGii toxin family protein [Pirellulaceae bacterium]
MEDIEFLKRIKTLVVVSIFSKPELKELLVLKGGNLLDLIYQLSGRSSVDVDMSMENEIDNELLRELVRVAVETRFAQDGYQLFDFNFREVPPKLSDEMKDFWGGYKIDFKIINKSEFSKFEGDIEKVRRNALKVGRNQSTKFKIDISCHEYCEEKEKFEFEGVHIFGYSPSVFVAEKIRAICQQMQEYVKVVGSHPSPRPRDFVDIYVIASHYGIAFDHSLFSRLEKVFQKKRVPLSLLGSIKETFDFHATGFESVRDTVLPNFDLQDFDFYFKYVVAECERLEPFWNE